MVWILFYPIRLSAEFHEDECPRTIDHIRDACKAAVACLPELGVHILDINSSKPPPARQRRPSITDVIKASIQVVVVPRMKPPSPDCPNKKSKAVTWKDTVSISEFTPATSVASLDNDEWDSTDDQTCFTSNTLLRDNAQFSANDPQTPTPPLSPAGGSGHEAWKVGIKKWRSSLILESLDAVSAQPPEIAADNTTETESNQEDDGICLGESALDKNTLPPDDTPTLQDLTTPATTVPAAPQPTSSEPTRKAAPLYIDASSNFSPTANSAQRAKPQTPLRPTRRTYSVNLSEDSISEITPSASTPLYKLPRRSSSIGQSSMEPNYTNKLVANNNSNDTNKRGSVIVRGPKRASMVDNAATSANMDSVMTLGPKRSSKTSARGNGRMSLQEALHEFTWLKGVLSNL
ncbi:hypothetical protein SeMB42_g02564 [Synchytrium endobioticum]|uniref:Uncharacterized protein n=1 Tax=Synchytrium endobioticum TaxID=286115 RepID=A0A507DD28_9FUNG|nr:hypothetical protein SeMB42_g02564 [Synchytrium endobioticum]